MALTERIRALAHVGHLAFVNRLNMRAVQLAADNERLIVNGRCLGLSEADAREVVDYWRDWNRRHLGTADDGLIWESMTKRACGERWHP